MRMTMVHYFFCTASFFVLFFNLPFLKLKFLCHPNSAVISLQPNQTILIPPLFSIRIIANNIKYLYFRFVSVSSGTPLALRVRHIPVKLTRS